MSGSSPTTGRWGRTVGRAEVAGHSCLVYTRRPRSLSELLVDARRFGARELLAQGRRRMTSADHERAVARLADHLRRHGVSRGDPVLLLGPNQIEWMVAFWALQCLGAVAVLGNAWWSDDEATQAIALVAPVLTITDRSELDVKSLSFADVRGVVDDGATAVDLRVERLDEDEPALIMFSSGTTGSARGVLMSQRSVVANIQNLLVLTGRLPDELPDSHPGTVSLLSVPLFHLAGIQISCTTLVSGGSLVFLEGRFDAGEVLRLIEAERVRVWGSIPTMVSRVLDHPDFGRRDTSSVTSVPMGGAAISSELRDRVAAGFPGVRRRVGSLYGLTEAGGVLAAGAGADLDGRPGCVGRALPVVELRIKHPDADGTGEIQARTPTMTGGYVGDPQPITDPDGWVSTGDLGRLDDDGRLYVTGRSKDIIIRGGENIASAAVERCLLSHPDVVEVAAVPLPHADLGEEIGVALVLREGTRPDIDALRAHAARHLAHFEVPSRWWVRDAPLPTNATGKILRREVLREWLERSQGGDW